MNTIEWIAASLFVCSIIFLIIYIIYGKLTDKKFVQLEELFYKKFGYCHLSTTFGKAGGIFFWPHRDAMLFLPLCIPWSPGAKKMKPEEREFIQSLPKNLTNWVKIKYSISLLSIICMLVSFLIIQFYIKK